MVSASCLFTGTKKAGPFWPCSTQQASVASNMY